ncbi:MAG: hypothetical protein LRY63_00530 [Nitrincola sp.]|nr:hypothetical protein [Nitrincola sp.]
MIQSLRLKAAILSILIFLVLLFVWQISVQTNTQEISSAGMDEEYALLMGLSPETGGSRTDGFPAPKDFAILAWNQLSDPFYDRGPNDKGIGIQLAHSLGRVGLGYLIAFAVAVPLGFVIGMSPLLYQALNPYIQVLKPISPLAWMPIALYTIKDSTTSAIFVIFICSIWPC